MRLVRLAQVPTQMQHVGMHGFRRPPQDAFTLIEVMMATAILLVGFIGMIQAITIGSESLDTSRKQQVATQLITAEIEKLRGSTWSVITSLPASAAINVNGSGVISGDATSFAITNRTAATSDDNTDLSTLARGFACSFTRTFLRPASATAANATYIKLVYTVSWTTNTGRVQTHKVDAYLAKSGLHLSYQQS